jgi:chromate transport protein ChrA
VARYQKGILVCLLIQLALYAGYVAGPLQFQTFAAMGVVLATLASIVFVFMLVSKIQDTTLGVVMAIATLIPCIGLLVLLLVNQSATKELRKEGIRVGLLGADLSKI